jgi:hypothetical protein
MNDSRFTHIDIIAEAAADTSDQATRLSEEACMYRAIIQDQIAQTC